ncbi:MAG: PDGLE domain-containing protein [Armatimonadetes bacterium]|nr:PDGLE domain-containing protein [Armatimonadota bacterium]
MKTSKKLWIGLFVMVLLSPLGLILPAKFCAGSAWGEWSSEEIHKMIGYLPSGMSRLGEKWKSPMPDYSFKGQEKAPIRTLSFSYIVSALVGVGIVTGITILIGKAIARRE